MYLDERLPGPKKVTRQMLEALGKEHGVGQIDESQRRSYDNQDVHGESPNE